MSVVYTWRGEHPPDHQRAKGDGHEREDSYRGPGRAGRQRRTDWERLRNMTEEEIEAAAASDPDNPPTDEEFWRDARTVYPDSPR